MGFYQIRFRSSEDKRKLLAAAVSLLLLALLLLILWERSLPREPGDHQFIPSPVAPIAE